MADILTRKHRSWNMSRIRGKNTAPELTVRSIIHRLGYRFRLHGKSLPGNPDIVLPGLKTVVLVHGCFWHRHPGCQYAYTPKSRRKFWLEKFKENVARDRRNIRAVRNAGWRPVVIWECDLRNIDRLTRHLSKTLAALRNHNMAR